MFCTSTMRMPVRITGKRQRQFDLPQDLAGRHAHAARRVATAAGQRLRPTTVFETTGSSE